MEEIFERFNTLVQEMADAVAAAENESEAERIQAEYDLRIAAAEVVLEEELEAAFQAQAEELAKEHAASEAEINGNVDNDGDEGDDDDNDDDADDDDDDDDNDDQGRKQMPSVQQVYLTGSIEEIGKLKIKDHKEALDILGVAYKSRMKEAEYVELIINHLVEKGYRK